jgi:hypothetical protein
MLCMLCMLPAMHLLGGVRGIQQEPQVDLHHVLHLEAMFIHLIPAQALQHMS